MRYMDIASEEGRERGRRPGEGSIISQSGMEEWVRRKSDFLSSFLLPSCEWHKSPKINLSVESEDRGWK